MNGIKFYNLNDRTKYWASSTVRSDSPQFCSSVSSPQSSKPSHSQNFGLQRPFLHFIWDASHAEETQKHVGRSVGTGRLPVWGSQLKAYWFTLMTENLIKETSLVLEQKGDNNRFVGDYFLFTAAGCQLWSKAPEETSEGTKGWDYSYALNYQSNKLFWWLIHLSEQFCKEIKVKILLKHWT